MQRETWLFNKYEELVDYQLEVDKGKLTAVANLKSWRFER